MLGRFIALTLLALIVGAAWFRLATVVDAAGILHGSGAPVTLEMLVLFVVCGGAGSIMLCGFGEED